MTKPFWKVCACRQFVQQITSYFTGLLLSSTTYALAEEKSPNYGISKWSHMESYYMLNVKLRVDLYTKLITFECILNLSLSVMDRY